ncbi:MAG: hypothetical protein OXU45_05610 [Candidatus Melainabacteria bacterium]|nr:hypothetical protein [Candidatus Melainabacteria bacterium]
MSNWHLSSLTRDQISQLNQRGWYLGRNGKKTILTTNLGRTPEDLGNGLTTQSILHASLGEAPQKQKKAPTNNNGTSPSNPLLETKAAAIQRRDAKLAELELSPDTINKETIDELIENIAPEDDVSTALAALDKEQAKLSVLLGAALDDILSKLDNGHQSYDRQAKSYQRRFDDLHKTIADSFDRFRLEIHNSNRSSNPSLDDPTSYASDLVAAYKQSKSHRDLALDCKAANLTAKAALINILKSPALAPGVANDILTNLIIESQEAADGWQKIADQEEYPEPEQRSLKAADIANLRTNIERLKKPCQGVRTCHRAAMKSIRAKASSPQLGDELIQEQQELGDHEKTKLEFAKVHPELCRTYLLLTNVMLQETLLKLGLTPCLGEEAESKEPLASKKKQFVQATVDVHDRLFESIKKYDPQRLEAGLSEHLKRLQEYCKQKDLNGTAQLIETMRGDLA